MRGTDLLAKLVSRVIYLRVVTVAGATIGRFGSKSDIFSSGSRPLSGLGLKIDSLLEALACDILSFDPETVMLYRGHVRTQDWNKDLWVYKNFTFTHHSTYLNRIIISIIGNSVLQTLITQHEAFGPVSNSYCRLDGPHPLAGWRISLPRRIVSRPRGSRVTSVPQFTKTGARLHWLQHQDLDRRKAFRLSHMSSLLEPWHLATLMSYGVQTGVWWVSRTNDTCDKCRWGETSIDGSEASHCCLRI